ncbi:MAG: glycosyltransferase family 4 protein, partial [Candidatus Nitrosotenuis sp.]
MSKFRILIAGNMVNQGFVTARELRKLNVDVSLLMEKNPSLMSDPAYLDSNLKDNYPEWIYFFDKKNRNWKFDVIRIMRKFDLVHAWVEFPIFALLSGRPFIANTQGSDFRELRRSKTFKGFLLNLAYKRSKIIIFNQPDYLNSDGKILKQKGVFIPHIWDDTNWQKVEKFKKNTKLIIFHPANLEFRIKKNQNLLLGFEKYIKKYPDSRLIIVDRGVDSDNTHELVNRLKIQNNVEFIPGPLDKAKMVEFYTNSDIVADQFGIGSMGTVALESMLYGKPLIMYIDIESHRKLYGSVPPLVSARTPDEIYRGLVYLSEENERIKIG